MGIPMTFRESIRQKLIEGFININELFYMKNFSILQVSVLRKLAQLLGTGGSPTETNTFLKSPTGTEIMRLYRDILIKRFGEDGKGMPNSDSSVHPGFNPNNIEAHAELINSIASEILQKIKG